MVIKEISPIDFLKRFLSYKKIIVIDIRSSSEYYQYHLKDSINIPINKLLNDYSYLLNKHTQYYLVCNDGRKSKYISKLLKDEGYNIISVILGYFCRAGVRSRGL